MRQERLLRRRSERCLKAVEKVCYEGRALLRRRARVWSYGLAFTGALVRVWPTAMDLEVRVGVSAVENPTVWRAVRLRHVRVDIGGGALLEVHGSVRRIEVGLTRLQVLNLARGIFRTREAAVQASHFGALWSLSQYWKMAEKKRDVRETRSRVAATITR